jgi:hypothetical protein
MKPSAPFSSLRHLSANLGRRDVVAIIFAVAILLLFAATKSTTFNHGGFGPEWDCTNPGGGGSVCVKKTARPTDPSPANRRTSGNDTSRSGEALSSLRKAGAGHLAG